LPTAFEKRWLSLGMAAAKKIISMAAWREHYFFCCLRCWLFNINVYYRIFSEHACMSQAKKSYNATLCYLASGSFFWRGFLLRGVGCTCLFFCKYFFKNYRFHLQKNKVVQVCRLQKP